LHTCTLIHFQSLAAFLRKRDPRYKAFQEQQHLTTPSQSGTVTPIFSAAAVAAARKRVEASQAYVEQEWQRVAPVEDDNDWAAEMEGEEWECVVCNKSFRSEAAWNSHERSRKHLREVERFIHTTPITVNVHTNYFSSRLREEMQEEEEELQLARADKFAEEGPMARTEDAAGDDMVALPPEFEPEDNPVLDGIGGGSSTKDPRGEPHADSDVGAKKQNTSLDPNASARLQSPSDAREKR
jgi:DnaJ family protein A protein 5